ncbi:MAG: hypothetical protein AAGH87_11245 [Pseudomonadota bacterium]
MNEAPLKIIVAWHPNFSHGAAYTRHIVKSFESLGMVRERRRLGVPVRIRTAIDPSSAPDMIDWNGADAHLIIYLAEHGLKTAVSGANPWSAFHQNVCARLRSHPDTTMLLSIAMQKSAHPISDTPEIECVPYFETDNNHYDIDTKEGLPSKAVRYLLTLLLSRACAFARRQLHRQAPSSQVTWDPETPIKVFLSHTRSKGRATALAIRERMRAFQSNKSGVEPYLDSYETPYGASYRKTFEDTIKDGVFVAIHTEDYATRSYCRWEMLVAKRYHRPIVVVHMLKHGEARTFPYSGNTPLAVPERELRDLVPGTQIEPTSQREVEAPPKLTDAQAAEIEFIVISVLSETLRFKIFGAKAWSVANELKETPAAILSRPPELMDVAELHAQRTREAGPLRNALIVYPDPPLDAEEARLVNELSMPYKAMSLSQLRVRRYVSGNRAALDHRLRVAVGDRSQEVGGEQPSRAVRVGISAGVDTPGELERLGYFSYLEPAFVPEGSSVRQNQISPTWLAMSEVITTTAQLGGRLIYGGEVQFENNLTQRVFQDLSDAYRVQERQSNEPPYINILAYGAWHGTEPGAHYVVPTALHQHVMDLGEDGAVLLVLPDDTLVGLQACTDTAAGLYPEVNGEGGLAAKALGNPDLRDLKAGGFQRLYDALGAASDSPRDRFASYNRMRARMATYEDARIVIGGTVGQNSTEYPGIMQEASCSIREGKLLVPLGGFGGAAHDVAVALGLRARHPALVREDAGALHSNYKEILTTLEGQKAAFEESIAPYDIRGHLEILAVADAPETIAENIRAILLKVFG